MLNVGLQAMESDGKVKNLASPSLITIDGKTATVNMQDTLSLPRGLDANGNTQYADFSGGPRLDFTPVLGRNGMVTITVDINSSSIPNIVGTQVSIAQRNINTQVRVRNGEPFVVGGLYSERRNKVRQRIPVLGYIPLLGDLFSRNVNDQSRTEVAMIVVPYILDVPDSEIPTHDLIRTSLGK
jgi:type IV pilus assembly protein PilQ